MTRGRPSKENKTVFKKISVYEHTFNDIKKLSKSRKTPVCVLMQELIEEI